MKKSSIKNICVSGFTSFSLALLSGCGEEQPSFSLLPEKDIFQQSSSTIDNKLDILWVIDNSGSMQPYQNELASSFNSFISDFVDKEYDFKIAVTATDAWRAPFIPNPNYARFRDGAGATHSGIFVITPLTNDIIGTFNINVKLGINGTGDERAFQSFREALNSPLNAGFLRDDSFLAIIIVSDEDDFSHNGGTSINRNYNHANLHPVQTYIDYLDGLTASSGATRRYFVSAMAILDDDCQDQSHPDSIIGQRYIDIANATGGVLGSLCDANFSSQLNAMQMKISELSTQFFLSRVPVVESIEVLVDGVSIPQDASNGWTYHADANSIRFHGSAIPPQGATITVDFDPVTVK